MIIPVHVLLHLSFLFSNAPQAEQLATKHEQEADKIMEVAQKVREKSRKAVSVTGEAVHAQKEASVDIDELRKRLALVEQLKTKAVENSTQSHSRSQQALDEAEILYANGISPLPDLGITELQGTRFLLLFLLCPAVRIRLQQINCFQIEIFV